MSEIEKKVVYKYVGDKKKIKAFISTPNKKVPAGAKLVFLNLYSRLGGKNTCWPSQTTIAEDTGFSVRQVRNHLNLLLKLEIIRMARRGYAQTVDHRKNTRSSEYDLSPVLRYMVWDKNTRTGKFIEDNEELTAIITGKEVPTNYINELKVKKQQEGDEDQR